LGLAAAARSFQDGHFNLLSTPTAAAFWTRNPARILWRLLRWALALLGLLWGLMLLAWLVLQWAILPHIDDWRPRVEQEASRALRVPVRIGSISAARGSWMPLLRLSEVRLLDPQGREALRLPRVDAALSASSLLTLSLRFEQLLIDAPQLEMRRDAQGHLFVAGLSLAPGGQPQAAGRFDDIADWFFAQREFVIRGGRIRWTDEMRQAAPLELSDLNLVVRNGLRQHALRLDATPPPEWGERFSLRGRFNQNLLKHAGDLHYWTGQLYAELPRVDLRALRRHVDLPFELSEGDGALRVWVDVKRGEPVGATVDMGLRSVRLRLAPQAEPLNLAQIEGRLQLQRDPGKLSLQATQLGFVSLEGDGKRVLWPRSSWGVALRLQEAHDKPALDLGAATLLGGELNAERLDFALMAQIAERLPIGAQPREFLDQLAPQGVLSGLSARWDGPLEAPASYRVKARLEGLRVNAKDSGLEYVLGRPGLAGASVELDASERGGTAQLSVADGGVELPGLFEEPAVPLQHLSAKLAWRIDPPANKQPARLEVRVSELQIENADLKGSFDGLWRSSAHPAGYLELNGRIDQIDAVQVQRYLPAFLVNARSYVRGAVLGGQAHEVTVHLRGELDDFPFASPAAVRAGEVFRIATQAQGVQLAYVPADPAVGHLEWPAFEQVDAELIFERSGMQIRNGRAHALGYELVNVNGGIKDLGRKPVLDLEGSGRGPMQELLRFMRASPLDEWTGRAMSQAQATGNASLRLALQLPLDDMDRAGIKGSVLLAGNDVRLRPDVPLLGNARARVEFDRKGVTVSGGQAHVLGGDATFEGGTQKDGVIRFSGQGVATAEALKAARELGLSSRIGQSATGQAAYKLQLAFGPGGQMGLDLGSTLAGMGLNLPVPLRKDADSALPLHVQITPQGPGRDELRVEAGTTLLMQYQRDVSGDAGRVLRGAVAVQDALPALPQAGVVAQGRLGAVNGDAWLAAARSLAGTGAGGGAAGDGVDAGYLPNQISLHAQSLQVAGRPMDKLTATFTRTALSEGQSLWRAQLDADQVAGTMELRLGPAGQLGRVISRLSKLIIPKQEVDPVTQLLDHGLDSEPGSVPALDIVVEDFELRGKKLGRLEIDAQSSGPLRDWHLSHLAIKNADANLSASGEWAAAGRAARRTQLDWKLEVLDGGKLLERLGQGQVLRNGKGVLEGRIGWTGSPLALDYASMSGDLKLALDAGQFLKAEPGVARLLGVLSLQSLTRRLTFDFRDVFSEGFAFDSVEGNVSIAHGVASSHDLKVKGVQATVQIEGRTDLAAETQDLHVSVVPVINAGGASLAYAAINPAVGLGTFLAQLLLSKPISEAGTREFRVSGSWDDPKVDKVERAEEPASGVPP
jgi:uncharacterized protein (TIGR02099 family)